MASEERSVVARRIEEIRTAKNLSRQELADRMSSVDPPRRYTRLQVWRIETGVKDISAQEAGDAATALEVPIADIYGEHAA